MDNPELRIAFNKTMQTFDDCMKQVGLDLQLLTALSSHDREGSVARLTKAYDLASQGCEYLKTAILRLGQEEIVWKSRVEFDDLANEIFRTLDANTQVLQTRAVLLRLSEQLKAGKVRHHTPRKHAEFERFRAAAIKEIDFNCQLSSPPELIGTGESNWLSWAWNDSGFVERMDQIRTAWPLLVEFLEEVDPRLWECSTDADTIKSDFSGSRCESKRIGADETLDRFVTNELPTGLTGTCTSFSSDLAASSSMPDDQTDSATDNVIHSDEIENDLTENTDKQLPTETSEEDFRSVDPNDAAVPVARFTTVRRVAGPDLPVELQSIESFSDKHWINPEGICELAPWSEKDFLEQLNRCLENALAAANLSHSYLFARGVEASAGSAFVDSDDIRSLAELITSPESASAGLNAERGSYLLENPSSTARTRLKLFLEGVRPTTGSLLCIEDYDSLLDLVDIKCSTLKAALRQLLHLAARRESPLSVVRSAMHVIEKHSSPEEIIDRLKDSRFKFHALTHGGGIWRESGMGQLKKHCKEAFRDFVEEGEETWSLLYPSQQPDWNADELGKGIRKLKSRYKTIADNRDCRYSDRRRMDRAVDEILDGAIEVNEVFREWLAFSSKTTDVGSVSREPFERLKTGPALERPEEELSRRAILYLLGESGLRPNAADLEFKLEDLCNQPALLALLPATVASGLFPMSPLSHSCGSIDDVVKLRCAAALVMRSSFAPVTISGDACEFLVDSLETSRNELLGSMSQFHNIAKWRSRASRHFDDLRRTAHERVGEVERAWHQLAQLGVSSANSLRIAFDQACKLVDDPGLQDLKMFVGWLDGIIAWCNQTIHDQIIDLRKRAAAVTDDERRTRIEAALECERLADALYGFNEQGEVDKWRIRETSWRSVALERYADPRNFLDSDVADSTQYIREAWVRGVSGQVQRDQPLRTAFVKFICSQRQGRKGNKNHLYRDAVNSSADVRLRCQSLREWITDSGLNPSFLPQLARFAELVVLTPKVPVNDTGFIQRTADQTAKCGQINIVVVLAPGLTQVARLKLLEEFRRRSLVGAVIDDIDLCRLLNPDGGELPNLPIALFELVLEQQRWLDLSPFQSTGHGQNVPMELFVGRKQEAEQLFNSAGYSRLFSGRKLGKSALLKFVSGAYDGEKLPSGNSLRVILIPAVGPSSDVLVNQIRVEMQRGLNFLSSSTRIDDPAESLAQLMDSFVRQRPRDSLLVILDEADTFVEEELRRYQEKREQCLSFVIRTRIEALQDLAGLPRVRFIFSGYRVTNTTEAAWANWGEVLRLTPLDPPEAEQLLSGPLARLGIDLSEQSRVAAWICGYQPAVLLRFGQELLKLLHDRHPFSHREHVIVTSENIVETFQRDAVRDEIRTVVKNNFQDNRLGWLVFSAALLEFKDAPLRAGLSDAANMILHRLQHIDNDTSWLLRLDSSALREIERQLTDFVARQLLVEERDEIGEPIYHLKFPHHLAVLCPHDQDAEQRIREDIAAFRRGGGAQAVPARALLSPQTMQELHESVKSTFDIDLSPYACVVASHWPLGLEHPRGGLPALLGIAPDCTVVANSNPSFQRDSKIVVKGTQLFHIESIEKQRVRGEQLKRPLFLGGAQLLRDILKRQRGLFTERLLIRSLGRLSHSALDWWFKCIRCCSLAPEALDMIMHITAGIPLLVGLIDEVLLAGEEERPGRDITPEEFDRFLAEFERRLPNSVLRLNHGDDLVKLDNRELQILKMIVGVSQFLEFSGSSRDIQDGITKDWEDVRSAVFANEAIGEITEADRVSLLVIQELGLLPVSAHLREDEPFERIVPLRRDDPVIRIVRLLEPSR